MSIFVLFLQASQTKDSSLCISTELHFPQNDKHNAMIDRSYILFAKIKLKTQQLCWCYCMLLKNNMYQLYVDNFNNTTSVVHRAFKPGRVKLNSPLGTQHEDVKGRVGSK